MTLQASRDGSRPRRATCASRASSLSDKLREVEKQKAGHVDRYAATRKQPLDELVVAYRDHLTTAGSELRYVQATVRQIRAFIKFANASTLPTIVVADAERFVEDIPHHP